MYMNNGQYIGRARKSATCGMSTEKHQRRCKITFITERKGKIVIKHS